MSVQQDLEDLELEMTFNQIKACTKEAFKDIVKKHIKAHFPGVSLVVACHLCAQIPSSVLTIINFRINQILGQKINAFRVTDAGMSMSDLS